MTGVLTGTQRSLQQYRAVLEKVGVRFPCRKAAALTPVGGSSSSSTGGAGGEACGSVEVDEEAWLRLACGVRASADAQVVTYRFARTSVAAPDNPLPGPPSASLLDLRALQSIQAFL